ncbi:MAG: histone H1 [Spirochaetes bacterium]|nr:histone H1 [Spirochaetota bacterium]
MKTVNQIKEILSTLEGDVEKLEVKKVKAAASRVRKGLMQISRLCKEGRKEAMDIKASI